MNGDNKKLPDPDNRREACEALRVYHGLLYAYTGDLRELKKSHVYSVRGLRMDGASRKNVRKHIKQARLSIKQEKIVNVMFRILVFLLPCVLVIMVFTLSTAAR